MSDEYEIKLTLHIPHFSWENDALVKIDHESFCEVLAMRFNDAGITDWYEIDSHGRYKGRRYDQELWKFYFCKQEQCDFAVRLFLKVFQEWNTVLCQEAAAYECNGKLFVTVI